LRGRASANGTMVKDVIFNLTTGPDPLAPFSDAIPVGEGQFLIVRLDELEPAREETFEEAKMKVQSNYIEDNAGEALQKEVESKIAALKESMAAGQGFEEAAKALELEPRKLDPFARGDQVEGEPYAAQIFNLAATVNPGEFAEPLVNAMGGVIIHVDRREIVKDDNRGGQIDGQLRGLGQQAQFFTFNAWLRQRISEARVSLPGRS
jgi:hypothetical protein